MEIQLLTPPVLRDELPVVRGGDHPLQELQEVPDASPNIRGPQRSYAEFTHWTRRLHPMIARIGLWATIAFLCAIGKCRFSGGLATDDGRPLNCLAS
jgi:hypothetical protein